MKKNGKYVGVDEKYIPEDEKYVDNSLNDEIKNDMNTMYRGAKEYVSDKENQKKIKNTKKPQCYHQCLLHGHFQLLINSHTDLQ